MRKGFSLVELMVVIAIIAILSTIALYGITKAQASARDVQRQQIMNGVRTALERYYNDKQYYPGAAVTNNWSTLISDLSTYATTPTDPCAGGSVIQGDGTVGSPQVCSPTKYAYAATPAGCTTALKNCTVYTLTLTKESGGSSTFESPQ